MENMDVLEINRLKLRCEVGFSVHELGKLQEILISLRVFTNAQQPAVSDNVEDGIDLKKIAKSIINSIGVCKYALIEAIAIDVIHIVLLQHARIERVEVKIEKPHAIRFSEFSAVTMSRSREELPVYNAILSIGSNINPNENIVKAMKIISDDFDLQNVSPVYETKPINEQGEVDNKNDSSFYNLACEIQTILDLKRLKRNLKEIETRLGRVRDPSNKFARRTIDLDVFYHARLNQNDNGDEFISSEDLKYLHVVIPVADVQPSLKCDGTSVLAFTKKMTGLAQPNLFFPIAKDGTDETVKKILNNRDRKLLKDNSPITEAKKLASCQNGYVGEHIYKVAIVTGGTSKLGRFLSEKLHEECYCVVLLVNRSIALAKEMVKKFNDAREDSAFYLCCDFLQASQQHAHELIGQVVKRWCRIDLLVNNASIFETSSLDDTLEDKYRRSQQINSLFPLLLVNSAAKYLENVSGSVLNICDIHSERPLYNHIAYCTSKASLVALTKSLAKELASKNVRVNGINVGAISFMEGKDSEAYKNEVIKKIPLSRLGEPRNIADTVVFLANNDYITGQIINVDGGRTLNQ